MNSIGGTHPSATARRKTRRRRRRGGAPSTPLRYWTFHNNNEKNKHAWFSSVPGAGDESNFSGGGHVVELSARKLAAGLWWLRSLRYGIGGGFSTRRRSSDRSHFGPSVSRVNTMLSRNQSSKEHREHQLRRSQSTDFGPKQGALHKHSKSLKEGASRCSKASIEAYYFTSHMRLLEDQVKTMSFVSALQAELVQARLYIHDLEYEVRSSRNRVKYLARKLGVERRSRENKEHDKIFALIDDLKVQLSRERKKLQKMDVINSQLVNELAEAKLSAMQSVQKHKDERRTRKLLEEVCHELARKIGESEAEVEAMRIEMMEIREEVEEERNMLQVAEVLREERVQMKLFDAKLALESKYSQLNKLITVLETFLRSRSTSLDIRELKKAELIEQAVKAVSIQNMEEFSYEPLGSCDIFSIFEELQQVEVCKREIETWFNYSLTGDISDYHPVSPQENYHDNDHVPKRSSGFVDYNSDNEEDTKGHEGVNHVENQDSVEESGHPIVTIGACRSAPRCEIEWDETATGVSPNTETNEACLISAGPSKRNSSSAKLQASCASSSGSYKAITDEGNGQLSSRITSSPGTYLLNGKSIKVGLKHQKPMEQYGSMDIVNPHVVRGMKGFIERARGYENNTLKAKLSESRTQSKKPQLQRHNTNQ
ncbi:hypothetical protein ERO13_A10G012900v2 [Gossypium hirsutum]|uniref:Uncharacterized protein isoform X1 n=1 Tax=Gossypium hirsutum TaxID=3635 RepID=A0A1U8LE42_GOSHI|nr:uncharacterized protein LOC107925302 isoform X1 [Gossypium hirsutum]KAG4177985.1 hypothetical protein ERO13_A10G012900v2 [Gossypium hirsutum]